MSETERDSALYRRLASAVIFAAVSDADKTWKGWARDEGIEFLTRRSADLEFWCAVAGIDVCEVLRRSRHRYRRFLAAA